MSEDEMRKAFEEWWKTKFAALMAHPSIPKDYWQFWEGEYWCSWQAAWQAAEKARAK